MKLQTKELFSDSPIFEQHLSSARICSCSEAAAWCSQASMSPRYLSGSCECSSMGRGVPAGPPRVSASMKHLTTAARRAVANSSSAYLHRQQNNNLTVNIVVVISSHGSVYATVLQVTVQLCRLPTGIVASLHYIIGASSLCSSLLICSTQTNKQLHVWHSQTSLATVKKAQFYYLPGIS